MGLLALASCTPPLYLPNTVQAPTLLESGEVEVGTYYSPNFLNVQAAAAVTDNIGILASGVTDFRSSTDTAYHHFGEIGVGYTYHWADLEKRNKVAPLVMGFLGYGAGVIRAEQDSYATNDETYVSSGWGNYDRFFLQLGGGFTQKNVELLFNVRGTFVNFKSLYTNFGSYEGSRRYNTFLEPALTIKTGGERLKFFGQFGLALSTEGDQRVAFRQEPLMLSLGINYQFNFKK
ncbi:MAG: hypothetical protein ACI9RU_000129 [Litorivivens sp.]|jgi:hypothetical protein